MKVGNGIFKSFLDWLFDSPVVTAFQRLSGYAQMVDGYTYDGVRVVRDGVVSLFFIDLGSGDLALVDAGYDTTGKAIKKELDRRGAGLDAVKAILLTHGHIDHIGAVNNFPNAQVMVLGDDVDLAEGRARSRGFLSRLLPPNPTGIKVSRSLKDGAVFPLGNRWVRAYSIPGHTPGSAAFLIDDMLFVGDSAFAAKDGRMVQASWPFTDSIKASRRSVANLARRLECDGVSVKTIFFSHSSPLEKGLAPLLKFAEKNGGKS